MFAELSIKTGITRKQLAGVNPTKQALLKLIGFLSSAQILALNFSITSGRVRKICQIRYGELPAVVTLCE